MYAIAKQKKYIRLILYIFVHNLLFHFSFLMSMDGRNDDLFYCCGCATHHEVCTVLATCKHAVCYECLSQLVSTSISTYSSEIKCPKCNVQAFATLCARNNTRTTPGKANEVRPSIDVGGEVIVHVTDQSKKGAVEDSRQDCWRLWKEITSGHLCSYMSLLRDRSLGLSSLSAKTV